MADTDQEEQEPSIEEILSSIRQIISDDDDEDGEGGEAPAADEAPAAEPPPMQPDPEPEEETPPPMEPDPIAEEPETNIDLGVDDEEPVIELTDIVEGDDAAAEPEPAAEEPAPEPEPVAEEPAPEPEPEPAPVAEEVADPFADADESDVQVDLKDIETDAAEEPPEAEVSVDDDLESLLTENAAAAALDGFTELVKKTAVETGGITLEEIVRSELNPLLRSWLDKNLPGIIERLVKEELDKIASRALDDE